MFGTVSRFSIFAFIIIYLTSTDVLPFYRLDTINNLEMTFSGVEDRFAFAHKIATDLFQYMTSFSTGEGTSSGMMVVPMNIFDRWMERFTRKYNQDPNFMMKTTT